MTRKPVSIWKHGIPESSNCTITPTQNGRISEAYSYATTAQHLVNTANTTNTPHKPVDVLFLMDRVDARTARNDGQAPLKQDE